MVARVDNLRNCQGIWQSQIVVANRDVAAILGQRSFVQSTGVKAGQSKTELEASRKRAAGMPEHLAFVAATKGAIKQAKAILAGSAAMPPSFTAVEQTVYTAVSPGRPVNLPAGRLETRPNGEQYLIQQRKLAEPDAVRWEAVFKAYCENRAKHGNPVSFGRGKGGDAIQRIMAALFRHIGTNNMRAVTRPQLELWVKETNAIKDHVTTVKTQFRFAFETDIPEIRIPSNPADGLTWVERATVTVLPYTAWERARTIQAGWACPDPNIRIPLLISGYTGARIAEIAEATTHDIVVEDGIPLFVIREEFRAEGQTIKTAQSERRIALHSDIRDEVMAHHASRPSGALFDFAVYDGRMNTAASNRIADFVWETVYGLGPKDKRPRHMRPTHSFRHYVSTFLEIQVTRGQLATRLADYITGHKPPDVKGRKYIHWPAAELARAIEMLPSVPREAA